MISKILAIKWAEKKKTIKGRKKSTSSTKTTMFVFRADL